MSIIEHVSNYNVLLQPATILQLVFGSERTVIQKKNSIYIGDFIESNNIVSGQGTAYYFNGISIQGIFQDNKPTGECTVYFDTGRIKETVHFNKGLREDECSTFAYPSGLEITAKIQDCNSSLLVAPTIPYFRNYYSTNSLTFAQASISSISITKQPQLSEKEDITRILSFLEFFDIQQSIMIVDLLHPHLSNLPSLLRHSSIIQNPSFNLIEQITLCCQALIQKSQMYYLLPEITISKNFTSTVQLSSDQFKSLITKNDIEKYNKILEVILDILHYSNHLTSITFIASPLQDLSFTDSVFSRITYLSIKGNFYNIHLFSIDCFLTESITLSNLTQLKYLSIISIIFIDLLFRLCCKDY